MRNEKKCSKCHKVKPLEEFYKSKSTKDGRHHYCAECHRVNNKISYDTKESFRKRIRLTSIINKYGLTPEQLNNLHERHNGKCAICDKEFKSKRTTCIDHDHNTGKVRGLLCSSCNNLLGQCYEDTKILESAISYLKLHTVFK